MAHPYRTRPNTAPAQSDEARLDVATFGFGFGCALVGQALGGPGCCLVVTVVGVLLLVAPARSEAGRQRE